jgi:hypothetical protein
MPDMTLKERLALAREIAARNPVRIVICNAREEARQIRYAKAKSPSKKRPTKRKPK